MSEETNNESNVRSTIEAMTALVKAVPVYDDAFQPAAKQVGRSLETVTKVVNIALLPLRGVVWGYEKIEQWFNTSVAEKLKSVPDENIIAPPLFIAGPTIDAVKYAGEEDELRNLYASLLATSMNKETVHKAHPGYVDIIRNITTDEAYILKCFIDRDAFPCIDVFSLTLDSQSKTVFSRHYSAFSELDLLSRKDLVPSYLDNLCRLGLLEIPEGITMFDLKLYVPLEAGFDEIKTSMANENKKLEFDPLLIRRTAYGAQFIENIVK